MPSKARQKKIIKKLNRAQKCSILGPQNLGSRGGPGPRAPPESAHAGSRLQRVKKMQNLPRITGYFKWVLVITELFNIGVNYFDAKKSVGYSYLSIFR